MCSSCDLGTFEFCAKLLLGCSPQFSLFRAASFFLFLVAISTGKVFQRLIFDCRFIKESDWKFSVSVLINEKKEKKINQISSISQINTCCSHSQRGSGLSFLYFHFSYLYLSLAGSINVYTPSQGTNREKYFIY